MSVINVDPTGLEFFSGHQRVAVAAQARDAFDLEQFALGSNGQGDLAQKKAADRQKLIDAKSRAETVAQRRQRRQPGRPEGRSGRRQLEGI
jgi:hypothetical protein